MIVYGPNIRNTAKQKPIFDEMRNEYIYKHSPNTKLMSAFPVIILTILSPIIDLKSFQNDIVDLIGYLFFYSIVVSAYFLFIAILTEKVILSNENKIIKSKYFISSSIMVREIQEISYIKWLGLIRITDSSGKKIYISHLLVGLIHFLNVISRFVKKTVFDETIRKFTNEVYS